MFAVGELTFVTRCDVRVKEGRLADQEARIISDKAVSNRAEDSPGKWDQMLNCR